MSSLSMPSVTLVIKAPNQKITDHRVECTVDWTVRRLKQHLSKVYPTNPAESQQRIIYSGKLLRDEQRLQEILKQYEPDQTLHTVHLVCMASMSGPQSQSSSPTQDTTEGSLLMEGLRRRLPAEVQTSNVSSGPTSRAFPAADHQSYVPHPGLMYYGSVNTAMPAMPPVAAGFLPYGAEQLQWMQQAYAQSLMQYMQQYQQAAAAQLNLPGPTAQATPVIPAQPANQNFPNDLQGAEIGEPDPPNQPIRINAQGGPVIDNEEAAERANGDWLDIAYKLVRLFMLLSVLYFSSTPQRFLAMMFFFLFVYLCRAGWLRPGRVENQNQDQREEREHAAEDHQEPQSSEDSDPVTNMVDLQATHRLSTLEVVWSTIKLFFMSLVPENPPPININ